MSELSTDAVETGACISELQLDRYFGQELAAEERAALNAHVQGCLRCALRHDTLRAQRDTFLARAPRWESLTAGRQRRTARRGRWPWLAGATATLAAAAAALLMLRTPELAERRKGRPSISLYVKRAERVMRANSGDTFLPGDLLRITYSSAHPVHLALFQRDAEQVAVQFADSAGDKTARVEAGSNVALDFSIRLDAEPGAEQLLALFCDRPTDLRPVRESLERSRTLPAVLHCQLDEIVLNKRVEP